MGRDSRSLGVYIWQKSVAKTDLVSDQSLSLLALFPRLGIAHISVDPHHREEGSYLYPSDHPLNIILIRILVVEKLVRDAHLLEEAGCFALVLEKIPAELGARVSRELHIPTIGIGAGGSTDGQVLVAHDMLGITQAFSPRFLRRYADLGTTILEAVGHYVDDVKSRDFPNEKEQY